MRPTYAVVLPVPGREQAGIDIHTESGRWSLIAIAPRGLMRDYVNLAVGDIPEVRIVQLSLLRYYGLCPHVNIDVLPVIHNLSQYFELQKKESDKLRARIKGLLSQQKE